MKYIINFLIGILLVSCQTQVSEPVKTEAAEKIPAAESIQWDTLLTPYFSITHPQTWTIEYDTLNFYGVVLLSTRSDDKDEFSENMVCRRRINENNYDLQRLIENSIDELTTGIPSFVLKEKNISSSSGNLVYLGEIEGLKMEWHQHFFVHGSTYTILTFTSEQKNTAVYLPYMNRMFNSFTPIPHELDR